jgi:hypothetical protein
VERSKVGQRFGKLLVVEDLGMGDGYRGRHRQRHYRCHCDCGKERVVFTQQLCNGMKTCGCGGRGHAKHVGPNASKPKDLTRREAALRSLFGTYRLSAGNRSLQFNLTREEFDALVLAPCYYCGAPPSNRRKVINGSTLLYRGIDRVDNGRGYIVANVVPCCSPCNRAKGKMPASEFLAWASRVHQHSIAA